MVLTYLLLSTLLLVGLVWLGRRVDGGRRSVARYHKAMDVLAEITHAEQPSQAKPPPARAAAPPKTTPAVRAREPHPTTPTRWAAERAGKTAPARAARLGAPAPSAPRRKMLFVDEAVAPHQRSPVSDGERALATPADHAREIPADPRPVTRTDPGSTNRARAVAAYREMAPRLVASKESRSVRARVRTWLSRDRRRAPLIAAVTAFVSVLTVALVAASLASSGTPKRTPPHVASHRAASATAPAPTIPPTAATVPSTAPPSTTPNTPAAPAVPPSGGGPTLAAISPDAGSPGQTVTIQGSGLMSSDSLIVALFGAQTAPTHCPSQDECVVTVPPPPAGPPSVPVQVRTSGGVSNALMFRYSSSPPA